MKRGIFVIHGSEIIRRGLTLILQNYFNVEITHLTRISELNSFAEISGSRIIIITETMNEAGKRLINRLNLNNKVSLIQLNDGDIPTDYDGLSDFINLQTSVSTLQKIISNIFKTGQSQKNDISEENGELTLREKDVLKSVALGLSNKEIAEKLFISIHTVISHRKNITEKLGINSISGLTVYAILNNIIDTENINPENLI